MTISLSLRTPAPRALTPPSGDVDIAAIASILGEPARCRILLALDDGRARAAGDLAVQAGVRPATASSHLSKMVAVGILTVERRGRNRFFRIGAPQIAQVIELLSQIAPTTPVRSLRQGVRAEALRAARTCYDHLAGRLGVAIMERTIDAGYLVGGDGSCCADEERCTRRAGFRTEQHYEVTRSGATFFTDFGVEVAAGSAVRYCLDWSERRHHLAGPVGQGLLIRLQRLGWLQRSSATWAVTITEAGRRGLIETFNILILCEPALDNAHIRGGRPVRGLSSTIPADLVSESY